MAGISIEPYLFFKGNCKEAMEFYKNVFGGELTVQTMGEVPAESRMPGADPSSVMHAALKGQVNLFGSDSANASDHTAKVELTIGGSDEAAMRMIFDKLADGGQVKMTLQKMFWGDIYGQLSDKYGVDWMMNIAAAGANDGQA